MSQAKSILPKNIDNIQRHFKRELTKAERKLCQILKSKKEIELEIETLKDGIEWTQNVYKVSTRS